MLKSSPSRRFVAVVGLIVCAAYILRLWHLGAQSLWHDEAWSIFSAYHPLAIGALGTDPNSPPFFYLALSAWFQLVGDSVWALRYASLMIGVVTVAVTACVARRWFGERVAITAAFLVATSPILWVFSQEIRAYITMPLCALVLPALLDQLLRAPKRSVWIGLLIVELLTLYTHNLSAPLVTWLNIAAVVAWARQHHWRRMGIWLATQVALALAYLPWLLTQRPTGSALNTPPAITLAITWSIWQSYFTGVQGLLNADPLLMALTAALGMTAFFATIGALLWRRSVRLYLLMSQALLVPLFELALIQAARIDFHPRYFIAGVPALLVLMAVGVHAFRGKPVSRANLPATRSVTWRARVSSIALITTILLATAVCFVALRQIAGDPVYQHDDFRAIAEYYTTLAPDDAIVVPYGWEPSLAYYAQNSGIRARIISVPLGSAWQTIAEQLNALHANRIEVLTWYQAPADLRGVFPCLLGAVTDAPPGSLTVKGLTTVRYDHAGPITLQPLTTQPVSFGILETSETQVLAGNRRACVVGAWTLLNKTDAARQDSARITAGLFNPLGWLLTQRDADLRDDHQIPTQYWDTGARGSAFTLLDYPAGLAAGEYPLSIGLYGSTSRRSLDVIRDGAPVGQSAIIGSLTVTPTTLDHAALAQYDFVPVGRQLSIALPDDPAGAACNLQPGQQYRVTALWRNDGSAPQTTELRLNLAEGSLKQQTSIATIEHTRLAWYAFEVPAQATGDATLEAVAPDGTVKSLRACVITPSDHLVSPPPMQHRLGVSFAGVGALAGFDLPFTEIRSGEPMTLTLHWLASDTPAKAYTVFTHLLDASGRVIAQDDSPPANGRRPTTGWVRGEYVIDQHTLVFKVQGQTYTGTATLEVGIYDPASGARVTVANGSDHVLLPVTLMIK